MARAASPAKIALTRVLRAHRSFAYTVPVTSIRFGTDGWRGVIADDFTFENVRRVAWAIARYIVRAEKPGQGVIVGYDNRFASERFAQAAAETIAMADVPVWLATAPCPSPAVSLLVRQRVAAGGVMITASHNPYRWNGIKFKASYGSSALPSIVEQIEHELAAVQVHGVPNLPPRSGQIQTSIFWRHISIRSISWSTGKNCRPPGCASSSIRCTAQPVDC